MQTSPSASEQPLPPVWWQRLHGALMPDYNRRVTIYWWIVVGLGAAALMRSLAALVADPAGVLLQVFAGLLLAIGAGLFPIRVRGTKQSYTVGEIFIFLVLLVHGTSAAVVVAAMEGFVGSCRTSKRWTSRLFSPASAALAMGLTGGALRWALAQLPGIGPAEAAPLLGALILFSATYFYVNGLLVAGVPRIKRGERFFQFLGLFSDFRWVGLAYAGSACVAALLFAVYRLQGEDVLLVMVPLLAMLLVTLHFYFRQQEAQIALVEANTERAAREAEAAARHLAELQASEQRFHSAFEHAAIGMALIGFDGRILQANPVLARLLGCPEAELAQRCFQELVSTDDRPAFESHLGRTGEREFEPFATELRVAGPGGEPLWLALHCNFFTEPGTTGACLILQAQDISVRRRAEASLTQLAFHDPLTGLPNRRRFIECLEGALTRYKTDRSHPWAVLFVDFDHFKLINDTLGHGAGDQLLVQLGRRIQERLRPGDIVARLGGDEFAILAEQISDERDAVVLAERLLEALRRPFLIDGVQQFASASIGITFSAPGYAAPEDVLRDADAAMYQAKTAGKARYALFEGDRPTAITQRLRLQSELGLAIERDELVLEYQPIFEFGRDAAAPTPIGFEALLRWQHPRDGLLPPSKVVPLAEASGEMTALTDFVLDRACAQIRSWQQQRPGERPLMLSVNLSASDLLDPDLIVRVRRALDAAGMKPQQLTLDLAAATLGAHLDAARATLEGLRRLGVRIAVGDFGAEGAGLTKLSKIPVDTLKIDLGLIGELERGDDGATVVAAIVRLGAELGKEVVAVGVDTRVGMQLLREFGCACAQGYFLAPPLAASEAGPWLGGQRDAAH
ncbi:MAG: EAL domain-containing protein [Burkholderiales bacterium]|nr:EAL domain-containing protein [Burkholderiales bacterium]